MSSPLIRGAAMAAAPRLLSDRRLFDPVRGLRLLRAADVPIALKVRSWVWPARCSSRRSSFPWKA